MNIRVYEAYLPGRVKGYSVYKDGYYTIVINAILDKKQQIKEYKHELAHITKKHHESSLPVDLLEIEVHE